MKLRKGTFGQFPAAMCKGKPSQLQLVFTWLCYHANESGECFPSLALLAEESGMARSSVTRSMKKLVEMGYVVRTARHVTGKREKATSMYEVIIQEVGPQGADGVGPDRTEVGPQGADGVGPQGARELNPSSEPNPGTTLVAGADRESEQPLEGEVGRVASVKIANFATTEGMLLAEQLFTMIRANNATYRPDVKSARDVDELLHEWGHVFDLVLSKDGRDPREVSVLIEWCQRDDFWKTNILSPKKFRKQYDQLRIKAATSLKKSIIHKIPTV